jgi:6,7-dimethyl-8-ribityllumazine synthase
MGAVMSMTTNETGACGTLVHQGGRFALVASRFNDFLVSRLVDGSRDALLRHGCPEADIDLIRVPGAFEIPVVTKALLLQGRHRAVVALGVVIRGATSHYDLITTSCTASLQAMAVEHGTPVGFGLVTAESIEQAIERCGTKAGNKGAEAAVTAIETVNLLKAIK